MIHTTTLSVDTGRLLLIDPCCLQEIANGQLPDPSDKTGFVNVGPSDVGVLLGPTGWGDGTYEVKIETYVDLDFGGTRVSRVTVEFVPMLRPYEME